MRVGKGLYRYEHSAVKTRNLMEGFAEQRAYLKYTYKMRYVYYTESKKGLMIGRTTGNLMESRS